MTMGESIRHALWVIVQFVVVAIALLLFLGVVVAYGMKISIWPIIAMMAIVVCRLLPKTAGVFGIAIAIIIACLYFDVMVISALFFQPLHFLMMCVVTTSAVLLLLKGKPKWLWGVVAFIYLGLGVYYLFNNDIVGPMEFMIRDRPVDVPAQWNHCYRFFWSGVLMGMITSTASYCSVIVIAVYVLYSRNSFSFAIFACKDNAFFQKNQNN